MQVTPADSRDDIQAAIDDLADDGGGRLHIAAGTYDVPEALVWRANVDLVGQGYATHLRATDATNVIESEYDEERAEGELHDATIADLRLDGNRRNVPDGRDPGDDYPDTHSTSGLWIPFAERVTVRNLHVESCHGHGIHPDAAIDCTVANNVVRDCLTGFHIATRKGYEYGPVRTVARGNHALDCRLNGLDFGSGGRECVMANNTVTGCGHGGHGEGQWAGIRLRGTDHAAVGNVVVDSARGVMLARQRSTAGGEVHWERGARLLALGNRVRNAEVGIEVRSVADAAVAANAVADAGTAVRVGDSPGASVSGTHAVGGGDGVVCTDSPRSAVTDNHVRDVEGAAVAVRECDEATVSDNTVSDAGAGIDVAALSGLLAQGNAVSGVGDGAFVVGEGVRDGVVLGNRTDGDLVLAGDDVEAGYNR